MKRREFLNVIGAAGAGSAAAALTGCARGGGPDKVVQYLVPGNDGAMPGVTVEYTTVCRECPAGCGMIARVRDGRAHKVEGNPDHPINRGKLCLRGQASLQGLYNPDRHRQPLARDQRGRLQPITWAEAESRLVKALAGLGTGHAAWIGQLETGSFDGLVDRWLTAVAPSHTRLRWELYAYEPLRAAAARVFGTAAVPEYRFDNADTIVSFGADFVETWVSNVEYSRGFSAWRQARVAGKHDGRYIYIAPRLSLTGQSADEWIAIRPGSEQAVAQALTSVLTAVRSGGAVPQGALASAAAASGVTAAALERTGRELAAARSSLVLPPGNAQNDANAATAHEAVLRLSAAAGNVDRTVFPGWPHALTTASTYSEMAALLDSMRAGKVSILFVHQADPAYSTPGTEFAEAVRSVPLVVTFSTQPDETTGIVGRTGGFASLVLPDHSPLESWGDYAPRPGITGLIQPAVTPLFDTRATGDVLLACAERLGHRLGPASVKDAVRSQFPGDEAAWMTALQHGGVFTASSAVVPQAQGQGLQEQGSREPEDQPQAAVQTETVSSMAAGQLPSRPGIGFATSVFALPPAASATPAVTAPPAPATPPAAVTPPAATDPGHLILQIVPSLHFYDGRLSNRPWSQEIPNPTAKAVWGSWVEIHPQTAAKLEIKGGTLLLLQTAQGKVELPALLNAGLHPDVAAIEIGQGHRLAGRFAMEAGGVNPLALIRGAVDAASGGLAMSGETLAVGAVRLVRPPVVLQATDNEHGAKVSRATTARDLTRAPVKNFKEEGRPSLYSMVPVKQHPGKHRKWGMLIDLDRCVGCNACAAACYAENNVPIVGKSECSKGREMSWLRVETYAGEDAREGLPGAPDPAVRQLDTRFYPSVCMQCDNAPCEYVCPVNATMHDDEGLNVQVYNRCVGTRFCSNNCPYKVRRFNWFTFPFESPLDQQLNPDVIHRTKGVMEKCTFCIQRIRRHEIDSDAEHRPIRDGELQTACMQTCPTDAIIFGDQKDPESVVHRQFEAEKRGYGSLEELNTYPNVQYLKRVRMEPA